MGGHASGKSGGGACRSRNVNVGIHIDGNLRIEFAARSTEIRGVRQKRIDNEVAAAVILTQREAHAILRQKLESAGDLLALAVYFLINHRLVPAHFADRRAQAQAAVCSDGNAVGSGYLEANITRIGTWVYGKIVFQLALFTVVHQINSRVDRAILHAREGGDIAHPATAVVATEIVGFPGERFGSGDARLGRSTFQPHGNRGGRFCLGIAVQRIAVQSQDRVPRRQEQSISCAMRQIRNCGIGLALIRLKSDGQFGGCYQRTGLQGSWSAGSHLRTVVLRLILPHARSGHRGFLRRQSFGGLAGRGPHDPSSHKRKQCDS